MPEFARLGEEAILRREELTRAEFDIYIIVLLHSYPDENGIKVCRKGVRELCEIHNLDYKNTMRRFVRMRTGAFAPKESKKKVSEMKTPWLKWEKRKHEKVIIPLVGIRNSLDTDFEKKKIVNNTNSNRNNYDNQTGKIVNNTNSNRNNYDNQTGKIVNNTNSNRNNYDNQTGKIVNNTIPSSLYTESLKEPEPSHNSLSQKKHERERENENLVRSKFSDEEVMQYVQILIGNGASIPNPPAYARKIAKTKESDAFIEAALYPANPEEKPKRDFSDEPCSVCWGAKMADIDGQGYRKCEHCRDEQGKSTGFEPKDSFEIKRLQNGLEMLLEIRTEGGNVESHKSFYSTEDWQWLMNQLKTVEVNY